MNVLKGRLTALVVDFNLDNVYIANSLRRYWVFLLGRRQIFILIRVGKITFYSEKKVEQIFRLEVSQVCFLNCVQSFCVPTSGSRAYPKSDWGEAGNQCEHKLRTSAVPGGMKSLDSCLGFP
jgi:hypothetical protein